MIERKFLAHYVDAAFSSSTPTYVRLGKNLEEYNEELNPDVEVTNSIPVMKRRQMLTRFTSKTLMTHCLLRSWSWQTPELPEISVRQQWLMCC